MHTLLKLKSRLLTLLLALFCTAVVSAQDYHTLQLDEVFVVKNGGNDIWAITPEEDGLMRIVGDNGDGDWIGSCLVVYSDEEMTKEIQTYNWTCYEMTVEGGHTYYIRSWNFTGQDFRARCEMGDAMKYLGSDPADGEPFYITSDNTAYLNFNTSNLTFTSGDLTINGNVIKIYNFLDYNELVRNGTFTYTQEGENGIVDWNGCLCARADVSGIVIPFTTTTGRSFYNVVLKLFDEGKVVAGDKMVLKMHGIKSTLTDELYNGDGELEVTWSFGGAPTTLVSSYVPDPILSWYNPGDVYGLATFTFSNDIKSAQARLEMGSSEADDFYLEEISSSKISVEGSKVVVDLSGVVRTYKTMGLNSAWPTFTFSLYNVIDANGNGAYSPDLGMSSSYVFQSSFKMLTTTVSTEFTPASGSVLTADNKEIEIWFNHSDIIEWSGVTFVYYTAEDENTPLEKVIPKSDLKVSCVDDETTIVVALPEGLYNANNIRLKVNVTSSTDGQEHPIEAHYNKVSVTYDLDLAKYAEPASGTTLEKLSEIDLSLGMKYSINENLSLVNVYGRTTRYEGAGKIVANGETSIKIVLDEPADSADIYDIIITRGAIGNHDYGESNFRGGKANPETKLSYTVEPPVEPEPAVPAIPIASPQAGETLSSLKEVTLTYPVAVSIASDFWNAPYVADSVGQLVIAGELSQINDSVLLFSAYEAVVKEGEYSLIISSGNVLSDTIAAPDFKVTYYVDGSEDVVVPEDFPGGEPIITPESGTQLDSLQCFTITFVDWGSFSNTDQFPVIKNANAEVVATAWNGLELEWPEDGDPEWNVAHITFEDPVVSDGEYTLVVPVALNSTGWTIIEEKIYEFQYTVVTKTSIDKVFLSDSNKVDVFTLSGVLLLRNADATSLKTLVPGFYIINGKKILLRH